VCVIYFCPKPNGSYNIFSDHIHVFVGYFCLGRSSDCTVDVPCSDMFQVAMRRVCPPQQHAVHSTVPPVTKGQGSLLDWFPQLWGWNSPSLASSAPEPTDTPGPSTTELLLEDQILDALADSVENNTVLRRDVVFGQFNFTVKRGTFNLCTTKATENDTNAEKYVNCDYSKCNVVFSSHVFL
jgi:vacuolar protein sorting-associated protein 13D